MNADHSPPHPDFEDADDRLWDAASWLPVPDVVDLVVGAATMESVFAAQRLTRIDSMRRELRAAAAV